MGFGSAPITGSRAWAGGLSVLREAEGMDGLNLCCMRAAKCAEPLLHPPRQWAHKKRAASRAATGLLLWREQSPQPGLIFALLVHARAGAAIAALGAVLVLAGTELSFFTIAGMELCLDRC